ncbi:hypothetical protein O9K51_00877 [Purpureocillium lavendulum]|uniref:Uncharacterized protein n=1 Tax=Purpureocillium lavendulum TaxID=1247861 RepID=A0AB34G3B8_9HYPO|nr:hypothetical protein O9K51_00877 [Purpureocillium lavendulum]
MYSVRLDRAKVEGVEGRAAADEERSTASTTKKIKEGREAMEAPPITPSRPSPVARERWRESQAAGTHLGLNTGRPGTMAPASS